MTLSPAQKQPLDASLPRWDLCDLYEGPQDGKLTTDLQELARRCESFVEAYGNVFMTAPTGDKIAEGIRVLESIEETMARILSYGFLYFTTRMQTPEAQGFFQHLQEKVIPLSSKLVFFSLSLNEVPEETLRGWYEASEALRYYKPWITTLRLSKEYQLSSELEKLLLEKTVTGARAWIRLYDETLESINFFFKDETLNLAQVLDRFGHGDDQVRYEAAQSLSKGLTEHLSLFTLITNTLAKDKEIEDNWRGYPHPVRSRNVANQVEDEVVEALVQAVRDSYGTLSHRYYKLKARWLGKPFLDYWDRNAPLPEAQEDLIPWEKAVEIVVKAYRDFSPRLATLAQPFFDRPWIDGGPYEGKRSGAFAHPTVPSVHPYLLLNFQGKRRDVMTLAHELGHGIHQVLAGTQGYYMSQTPLTLAETASVFGEMLTFRALLKENTSSQVRRHLLASKVEDMLNTVVRQIAFFSFEKQVHEQRAKGELTADQLGDIWMETQREALGEGVQLDPLIKPYWAYISHFIHSPFYVYAYAFGDCLVNTLYQLYEQGFEDFQDKYLALLAAGGSKTHTELLAPFKLDARDPGFWQKGLGLIGSLIDELEKEI